MLAPWRFQAVFTPHLDANHQRAEMATLAERRRRLLRRFADQQGNTTSVLTNQIK
jgi:hypothetical protein